CAQLKLERVVLVGHSMGGQIALACAAAWPERVAGLVLVASGAKIAVAPSLLRRIDREFAEFPAWFSTVSWSPTTARETVERWRGILMTADQEITRADF